MLTLFIDRIRYCSTSQSPVKCSSRLQMRRFVVPKRDSNAISRVVTYTSYLRDHAVPERVLLALYLCQRRIYSLNITWLCCRMSQGVVGSSKQRVVGGSVRRFVLGMRPVSIGPPGAFLPLPFGPSRNFWASRCPPIPTGITYEGLIAMISLQV